LEIILHIYIDDLQEVIQKSGSPELFLATKNEISNADSFIYDYISQNLRINNGDTQMKLTWVGKEQSDDLLAYWCYVETDVIDEAEGLAIANSILQDLYDDQQNILNVITSDGKEEYFLCRKGDHTFTVNE
jgi:hypothetical protein